MSGTSDRAVRTAIQKMTNTFDKDDVSIVMCTVESVDINNRVCVCTPVGGKAVTDITNVQLMAGGVNDGWFLVPTVGSIVIVCYSSQNTPYVCLFSAIDFAYLIVNNKIQFQGGEYGGLPIIQYLVNRLNLIEQDNNNLKAAFDAWVVIPNDGGAALKAASAAWAGDMLTETVREDIENTTITHGA